LRIVFIFLLILPSAWAFASDDPCYMAYWHVDKSSELYACEAAANVGVADAEFGYGLILWSSANRQHDHRAALDWFRKSARQGYQLAQSLLGNFLAHKDVEADLRNPVEAYAWRVTVGDQNQPRSFVQRSMNVKRTRQAGWQQNTLRSTEGLVRLQAHG
jgi:hypothetical protein